LLTEKNVLLGQQYEEIAPMNKILPSIACALFVAAGIAQAQVEFRIGPPPRPVERIPPPPHEHPD
jgi:hypothetical protein